MLLIQIEDVQLEKRIEAQARQAGQTTQEFVREVLAATVPVDALPRLNPLEYGRVLNVELPETDELDRVRPFAEVTDSVNFVKELRKKAWR